MISQKTIDKIFSTIRVEEIIGEYVQLKRAGTNFKGLSPFHEEKTPSFVVSPSKQIWKDFSSGKGGTAITFLMEIEGFTYPEALRHAAKKYGIEIEEDQVEYSEEQKKAQSEREILYKIHEVANTFFQENLWETEEGKTIALSYFKERELHDDIIKKFQLGYSPEKKNAFTEYALAKGYEKEILEKSGISIFPENSPSGIDRFRERVIFPIHSFSGRVLGFGARILKSNVKTAKYLNSPETEIYHKSNVLYGLNQSKQAISRENLCLLVEGYMDVISLHQSGIENVVASSGTALTTEQIKLIKRLTENVTILFDGDAAGIKASFRSIDMLLSEGMNIRVVLFPDGDDPDSFARKNPRDFVEDFIKNQAKDFIDFKAEILLKEANNDPIKKAEAIRDIVKSIGFVSNALKQEVYLKQVSTQFGLSEQSLFNELGVQKQVVQQQKPREKEQKRDFQLSIEPKSDILKNDLSLLELEEKLIESIFKYGNQVITLYNSNVGNYETTVTEEIINHFEIDNYKIQSPINLKIINEIKEGLKNNELRDSNYFSTLLEEEISTKLADSLISPYELNNWASRNIYPINVGDKLKTEIEENILIHKSHYIKLLIREIDSSLDMLLDEYEYMESIKKIMILKKLFDTINKKVSRNPVNEPYKY
ncbi:DNA primase [Cloacibacterium normanense]